MDLEKIQKLIDMVTDSDLSEFSIEDESVKIRIRRGAVSPPPGPAAPPPPAPAPAAKTNPTPTPALEEETGIHLIKSPMVGTFYRSPSPDSASFVETGHRVHENSVVCIIEAMKIMNEIQAETKGVITDILVENGSPVEYGQPLFKVKVS